MNKTIIRQSIVAVVVLQFLWFMILPAGNRLVPQSPEMAQALLEFETNRSAATESAMREQLHRDELRKTHRDEVVFISMLFADALAIYFFWNYGIKKIAV